jgi:hypothetical protein
LYHSIHARGETVGEVLSQAKLENDKSEDAAPARAVYADVSPDAELEDGEVDEPGDRAVDDEAAVHPSKSAPVCTRPRLVYLFQILEVYLLLFPDSSAVAFFGSSSVRAACDR